MDGETYLGDAVYASFDGYQIMLRTGDGNAQVIYLEPGVWYNLQEWVKELGRKQEPQGELTQCDGPDSYE